MPSLVIVSPTESDYRALADQLVSVDGRWQPSHATTVEEATLRLDAGAVDACLVDARPDGVHALGALASFAAARPSTAVVVIVPEGHDAAADAARKSGAAEVVTEGSERAVALDRALRSALLATECARLRVDLAEAQRGRRRAEVMSRIREELLSVAAHDLRNPLDAMLGWLQLLRSGHLDAADAQRALDAIERGARAQAGLITELQDMGRTTTGVIDLDRRDVDLAGRAVAAVDQARDAAARKQLTWAINAPDPVAVRADAARIDRVLAILVGNAVNATPRNGTVTVSVLASRDHARVAIGDEGPGLSNEMAPFVLDPIGPDGQARRKLGRAGLELIAARAIVEAHGGTIAAASAGPSHGTTFTVVLPRDTARHDV